MKPNLRGLREHAARRARLMKLMGPGSVAIIPGAREVVRSRDTHYPFRQDSDFRYLTGFLEPDAIAVLVPGRRKGGFVLFVRERNPEREIWDGRRAGPEGVLREYGADEAFPIGEFAQRLPELLSGRSRIFYNLGEHSDLDPQITAAVRHIRETSRRGPAAPTEFVALEASLHELRLRKTPTEVTLMKHAAEVTAEAHCLAMQATRPGRYEWQIAAEIHAHFARHNMEPGYGSIVGGGANGCILHYVENSDELRDGDLLLIDAGAEFAGYTADITRTFPINGRFSAEQRAVYEIVLAANEAAIKTLRPGVSSSKPHDVATRILTEGMVDLGLLKGDPKTLIRENRHRQFFMHGTGHWLGMDVHDVGRYRIDGEPRPFEAGMVMTVEPGLYIAPGTEGVDPKFWGIGIRIEDDVLITEEGPEVLTHGVPKSVSDIETLMQA